MSQKYEKLKTLLKELFQLDQPDLDFGLYRIMHAKAGEVTQFLDRDLLPQVRTAFEQYQPADKAVLQKELEKVVAGVQAAGMDPEQSPKVQELRKKLANEAVDIGALESEVYDHLHSFFRRYYSEGGAWTRDFAVAVCKISGGIRTGTSPVLTRACRSATIGFA